MNRAVPLLLLLVLVGCRPDAIHARVQIVPELRATCIALDVLSPKGDVLHTEQVPRPSGKDVVNIAVFQGAWGRDVQFQARALLGTACEGALLYNGRSAPQTARFERSVGAVTLELSLPSRDEDRDGDGFVSRDQGGADCDDTQSSRHPNAQEACYADADLNCNGLFGCEDTAVCPSTDCAWRPHMLAITYDGMPESVVGRCVGPLVVERQHASGRAAAPGYDTLLTFKNEFPQPVSLFADASCRQSLPASPRIVAGTSRFSFYLQGNRSTKGSLTASNPELAPALFAHSLRAGPTQSLAFTNEVRPLSAGDCTELVLSRTDAYNNPVEGSAEDIQLTTSVTGGGAFFADAGCTQSLPLASFPLGSSTRTLYFRPTKTGSFDVSASVPGPFTARLTYAVTAGPVSKLVLTAPAAGQRLLVGECSAAVSVQLQDAYGNAAPQTKNVSLVPSSAAPGGLSFFSDAQCTQSAPSVTLAAGQSTANLHFKGVNAGTVDLSVAVMDAASLTPVTQTQTLLPMVRRGSCTMESSEATKSCSMPVPLGRLDRSFLLFQATTTDKHAAYSFVRCALANVSTITCVRTQASQRVNIAWQVVERATGLRVQHRQVSCVGSNLAPVTFDSVQMNKTFVLSSATQGGSDLESNDFGAVRLSSSTQVDITLSAPCTASASYALQIVEMEGISVTRNAVDLPMTTNTAEAGGLSSVVEANSWVLATFRSEVAPVNQVCVRMVRGEIRDATGVRFTRALGNGACEQRTLNISWERITLVSGAQLQTRTFELAMNTMTDNVPLSPVDPNRTVALTSSQIQGGQGSGETAFQDDSIPGVATVRLTPSASRLDMVRDSARGAGKWTAYVIQFDP